jgi:formate dehydrogenase subunit delta
MANQIGTFFKSQKPETVVSGIADHIKKFWDPRMLRSIYAHVDAGGAGLDPQVLEALQSLKAKAA